MTPMGTDSFLSRPFSEVIIRTGRTDDVVALTEIYNHYVRKARVTFDTVPFTAEERRADWFAQFDAGCGPFRLLVAEDQIAGGRVIGYAASTRFRPKPAYRTSVETSVYLAPDCVGKGYGLVLYRALAELLDSIPEVHRAYGGVALPNDASRRLHERLGYRLVGVFQEVGYKFGRFHDVAWYERACDRSANSR